MGVVVVVVGRGQGGGLRGGGMGMGRRGSSRRSRGGRRGGSCSHCCCRLRGVGVVVPQSGLPQRQGGCSRGGVGVEVGSMGVAREEKVCGGGAPWDEMRVGIHGVKGV